ncbi:gala protein [Actinocorallia longicatena]|uniref:Leucine rich repeat (LRR) protein n=1 Tax=Actinocorallia longicatena TaxID=111803 RepID=A0ABP6PVT8_9ACTN
METRCPAIEHPDLPRADPALLDGLIERLADPAPITGTEAFALGTLQPDGRVDLCKQGLRGEGLARLLPALFASSHAVHLLLGTNGLGDAAAFALPEGHGLRTLYLGCNRISAEGATAVAGHLADDTEVRALWLKRNPVGDAGVLALAAMLRRNTTLRTLDLVNTGVTGTGLRALLEALLDRPAPIERLFLGGNGLGPDVAGVLAALVREAGVRELYLPSNHLGDEGAAILAAAADPARPLRLGLGGNGLTAAGVTALAAALPGLESLDLGRPPSQRALGAPDNVIGDEGVTALAAALPGSPISRLELRHTSFTGRAAKALLGSVREGTRLEYVGLGPGLPRKVKRGLAGHLRPAAPVHPDLHAIGSVYR